MNSKLILCLGLLLSITGLQAQVGSTNFSLQAGYQFKLFNPASFNFIVDDIFNSRSPLPITQFETVRWAPGLSVGAGYHKRRISLSVHFDQFAASTSAVADDSLGTELQWSTQISGWNAGINFASELIDFADNGGVYVGGAFQFTNIQTGLATAPSGMSLPDFEQITNRNKASFNIMLPIRYGPIPQFQFSIEPYFQVFFNPTNLRGLSERLNGPDATEANAGGVISDLDHFGVTAKVIVFLLPTN
ncbi:MAG: hypothetical protein AAF804_05945 [Bacteroidota bacterium]